MIVPAWPSAPGMLEQWLFALQASIVSASSLPDIATTFFSEVRDSRISNAQLVSSRDPRLAGLDTKLYAALIHTLIAKDTEDTRRILVVVRQNVSPGSGRQIVRVIIADFAAFGPRRLQFALTSLYSIRPVTEFANAEKTITEISELLLTLHGSPDMPAENMLLTILRSALSNTPRLKEVFTT